MKYLKTVAVYASTLPRVVWIAAAVVPGGFLALGSWLVVKSAYRVVKKRKK